MHTGTQTHIFQSPIYVKNERERKIYGFVCCLVRSVFRNMDIYETVNSCKYESIVANNVEYLNGYSYEMNVEAKPLHIASWEWVCVSVKRFSWWFMNVFVFRKHIYSNIDWKTKMLLFVKPSVNKAADSNSLSTMTLFSYLLFARFLI